VLLKDLEFGVHLVELVGQGTADHVGKDLLKSLFIGVFFDCCGTGIVIPLVGSFLAHLSDLLVDGLDGDSLDLAHWHAIDGLLILLSA
jgi:hypothetical protein